MNEDNRKFLLPRLTELKNEAEILESDDTY